MICLIKAKKPQDRIIALLNRCEPPGPSSTTRGRNRQKHAAGVRGGGGGVTPPGSSDAVAKHGPPSGASGRHPRSHPRQDGSGHQARRPAPDHNRGDVIGLDCANYALQ